VATPDGEATPVRRTGARLVDGCRVLADDVEVGHLDGGEEAVGAIVRQATDLSSLSDELASHRGTWPERYHFARERGNIVRGLDLPPTTRVLEIGAGCGAVTRYLGETYAVVDALEPTAERARIARERTRDLDAVEVFVGALEDLPDEPAYDLVVIVGVLEYVAGDSGVDGCVRFLEEARRRLLPGGSVACAIENRFGVEYVCGAPEEHLGRAFEGLEGYPGGGVARTFSRRALERIFERASLTPSVFGVLPDYKFARLLFSDALLDSEAQPLAWSAPRMPSRVSPHSRLPMASEFHVWRGLVEAGLGGEFANSFLVVGATDPARSPWPADQLAVFYGTDRRAAFVTESRVVAAADGLQVQRRELSSDDADAGFMHAPGGSRWVAGTPLMDVLEQADDEQLARWLQRWRRTVEAAEPAPGQPWDLDLVPHNAVVAGDELVMVDAEWFGEATPADIVGRGLVATGITLAERCPPERWPGCTTVRDVVVAIAQLAGAQSQVERLEEILDREAVLLADMAGIDPEHQRVLLDATLDAELASMPLGRRLIELREEAEQAYFNAIALSEQYADRANRFEAEVFRLRARAQ
jgi:SAM-dependent methyltransferase